MGKWRERLGRRVGTTGLPRAALRFVAIQTILALIVSIGLPHLSGHRQHGLPGEAVLFVVVVALVILANLFGLRMRVGNTTISVAWGEAAVIVGFTLIPAAWMPATVGVGILIGTSLRGMLGDRRSPFEVLRATGALTLSAGFASIILVGSGVEKVGLLDPRTALALSGVAVIYLLSTLVLLAAYLRARDDQNILGVVLRALRGSPIMIVGNLALGLLAALLWQIQEQRIFLLVLPPLLWLMHQLYAHRLREDEERRTWHAFALASRSLHRLDEIAVAQEGVRSARALFGVRRVELAVFGSHMRYVLDARSTQVAIVAEGAVQPVPADDGFDPPPVTKPLEVAGGPVGLLTLTPTRAAGWSANDQHRLAAFGDALHDAATHSALRDLHERTTYESLHDPLTRLLNRDALLDRGHALLRACAPDRPVALVLLDLDNFKSVNDTLGHLAGDELLQRTASRLSADAEVSELVARLGGDEFALLITDLPLPSRVDGVDPLEAAGAVALRRARALTASLATPIEVAGVMLSVEVTAGIVVATAGPVDLIELLRRADIALYQAKESGVRTMTYQAGRDDTSTDRLALVAEMAVALSKTDQLSVVLLPTVDLPTGEPIGVEALIRWEHPRRGQLIPKDFLRAVEASDLLGQFTRHVLDLALASAAQLAEAGLRLPMSVNLSPRSLLDQQLPTDLAEMLQRHGVPAGDLVLEIIETVALSPLRVTDQVIHALRALGVRFAVDDFGTGYSSLTFLTRIAVDELKVDRTFVARMGESKEAAAIVRAVVDLGKRLGIRVVAEGVESAEQRAALVRLGCDAGQGFHFARPVPTTEIVDVLARIKAAARPIRVVKARQVG